MVKSGKFVKLLDSQDFCKILRRKIVKSEEIGKLSISGARGQWVLCSPPVYVPIRHVEPVVSTNYINGRCPPTFFFYPQPLTMSVIIRPIEEKDKPEWLHLWTGKGGYIEFYNSLDKITPEISDTTFARFLDATEPVYSVVAVDDSGKVIGFANYLTHRNTWTVEDALYLNDLFVSSESRLHGVGRKLIEYIYGEADRLKCKKCYWSTQFENHRAQLLYTKVGVKSGFLLYRRP